MKAINTFVVISLTACLAIALSPSLAFAAHKAIKTCKKITIAGDSEWVPYVIAQGDFADDNEGGIYGFTGIGMELADMIISELDIPVERTAYSTPGQAMHALGNGSIDIIVSTYNFDKLSSVAEIINPAWIHDPVTIAVTTTTQPKIKHWEDLVGIRGIMENSFVVDDSTAQYFSKYLHVSNKGTLLESLQGVQQHDYGYAIGSNLQLNYAIEANDMTNDVIVVKDLSRGADGVHMAFAKRSACSQYIPYLRKRLQDHVKSGKVQKLVEKYMK